MTIKIGYICSICDNYIKILVPYHIWHKKYKKLLIKTNKFLIKNKNYNFYLNEKIILDINKKKIIKLI